MSLQLPQLGKNNTIGTWVSSETHTGDFDPVSSRFTAQRCDLEPIYERLLVGLLHLGLHTITKTSEGW